ncbi:MAG: CoA-binding protein [Hahellaceae bacterium]|nr:CoA-binding protein [Hahellaceae bacterium]MCP5169383.1 CoA-binding protein [Hahellaceae bacterium]
MNYSDNYLRDILTRVKTIALIGASDKTERPSHYVMAYLQSKGYQVIPVNPRLAGQQILGERVYASLEEIPQPFDMLELFIASDKVTPFVESAIALKAQVVWMQIGVIHHEAAKLATDAGLSVVMDHCPKQEIPRLGL